MKLDKSKEYYGIFINLNGFTPRVIKLKWYDKLNGFWNLSEDIGFSGDEYYYQNASFLGGYHWLIYSDRKEATAALQALETFKGFLQETVFK